MKILSMTGFRKICEEIAPVSFIFDTENQLNGVNKDVKMVMRYSDVIFMMNPNRICFKNEMGTLCLNRVKYVRYYDGQEEVGGTFSIICGNQQNESADVSYTIIIESKIFE